MAVYSISLYGNSTYGGLSSSQFAASLSARPEGYDSLFLTWNPPSGTWSDLRVVRSSYGFPITVSDGILLVDEPSASAPTSLMDSGLRSGRFYYYTLFVYATSDDRWVPSATVMGLVIQDHDYDETMWGHLPQVYKTYDIEYAGAHDDGPLRRFMGLLGYQVDRVRTEVDTLLKTSNIDLVSGALLPALANSLGVGYEPELGMRISRSLVHNAIHLAKTKGTVLGVEGVASSYTGFGATAVIGKNLLLDKNASGWVEPTVSTWSAVANVAVLDTVDAVTLAPAVADTGSLRIIADGVGDETVVSGLFTDNTLVPVTGEETYVGSLYVRAAATARSGTLSLLYYDAAGVEVGAFSAAAADDAVGSWARREVSGLAPAGAVWAALRLVITAPIADEVHYVGAAQLEEGTTATAWESARKVHVYLAPRRSNLVPNPSFETGTAGWSGSEGMGLSRDLWGANLTEDGDTYRSGLMYRTSTPIEIEAVAAYQGDSALAIEALEYGPVSVYSDFLDLRLTEVPYAFSAYLRSETGSSSAVQFRINWYTDADALISTTSGTTGNTSDTWPRFNAVGFAPATAAKAQLEVLFPDIELGRIHFMDAVLFEQSEFVKDYFDAGMYPPSDYLWEGTEHASISHLYPRRAPKDERLLDVLPDYIPAGSTFSTIYGQWAPAS